MVSFLCVILKKTIKVIPRCVSSFFLLIASCNEQEKPLFRRLPSTRTEIYFSNDLKQSNDLNIIEYLYAYNGGGVAIGDINNDDLPDIYFPANQLPNKLYLNKGNLVFKDITETAGFT